MEGQSLGSSRGVEERRLLTIMSGDMVGSTAIGEAIGPDSMHEMMKRFRAVCTDAVSDHDGVLANWMGDGFMAYFGYPSQHEDAAVRAVEAGLAVVEAVAKLAPEVERLYGVELNLRVGIHTGLVVLSQAPGREDDPNAVFFVGDTPNIAARIEASAPPGSVVLSEATFELVEGFFEVEPLGPHEFKGVSRSVQTFRAMSRTSAVSRYLARNEKLTPLIGRIDELQQLEAFALARRGLPSTLFALAGEPGLGKTRLLHELRNRVEERCAVLYCVCTPRTTTAPLYPFAQLIRATVMAGPLGRDPYEQVASALRPYLSNEVAIGRIANLAGVDLPRERTLPDVTPEQALRDTASAISDWLCARAASSSTVLLLDDVQWIDPTSADLLAQLRQHSIGPPVVLAYRTDAGTEWISSLCDSFLELKPLSVDESFDLISQVTAADDHEVAAAASRSDGVPLFAEELGRTLESGELRALGSIPNSLHDLILSRLDRIPEVKGLAQVGASIGRQFELDLLAAVTGIPLSIVRSRAELLESARIWEKDDVTAGPNYAFRHALIQDAAYDSQIRERKHQVHARLADVLSERSDARTASGLATVAHHLEHAGPARLAAAIRSWSASGFATANAGAHLEAISHFTHGLDLLAGVDDQMIAAPLELELQLGLGASLSTTAGYGQARVQAAFTRARELCALMGSPPELFPAVWGSWTFYLVRGDYAVAEDLALACAEIAAGAGDPAIEIETAAALGITYFYQGRLLEAIEQLTLAAGLYEATQAISPFQRFQHPAVAALSHLTLARWLTGDAEQAFVTAARAADLARSCEEHLRWFAREYAETFCAALGAYMGDAAFCLQHAQTAIDICNEHGSRMFLAGAEIYKGHAQVQLGNLDEGLSRLEAACESYLLTGATLFRPYHLTRLAAARHIAGNQHAAIELLGEAAELAERNGELVHLPEVLLLRGELMLSGSPHRHEEARADFERSFAFANKIGSNATVRRLEQHMSSAGTTQFQRDLPGDERVPGDAPRGG